MSSTLSIARKASPHLVVQEYTPPVKASQESIPRSLLNLWRGAATAVSPRMQSTDLIENIVLSGRAESITGLTGQPSLSFLLAMPEKEQKAVLHDLTVIKDPASKTVKHGIDMIRHWKAEGSFRSGMQSYMRETLEEEAIKVDEEERKAKLELLKVIISS